MSLSTGSFSKKNNLQLFSGFYKQELTKLQKTFFFFNEFLACIYLINKQVLSKKKKKGEGEGEMPDTFNEV